MTHPKIRHAFLWARWLRTTVKVLRGRLRWFSLLLSLRVLPGHSVSSIRPTEILSNIRSEAYKRHSKDATLTQRSLLSATTPINHHDQSTQRVDLVPRVHNNCELDDAFATTAESSKRF